MRAELIRGVRRRGRSALVHGRGESHATDREMVHRIAALDGDGVRARAHVVVPEFDVDDVLAAERLGKPKMSLAARGVPRHRQRLGTGGNVQTVNVGVSHRRQPRCAGDAVRAEVLHVRGDLRARLEVVGERVRGANREIENATGEERSDGRPGRHLILVGGHGKVRGERAARQHAKRVRRGMRRAPECHVHHVVSRLSGRESQQILSSPEILHRRRLPVHVHHRRRVRAMVHHVFLVRDRGHDPRGFAAHASLVPVLVVSLHQKRRRPLLPHRRRRGRHRRLGRHAAQR